MDSIALVIYWVVIIVVPAGFYTLVFLYRRVMSYNATKARTRH